MGRSQRPFWILVRGGFPIMTRRFSKSITPRDVLTSCLTVLLCLVLLSAVTFAQSETATLSGTVTDQSGAVIPGTQVQATNSDTGITATTKTNNAGIYVLPALKPGRYRMVVTCKGFKQVTVTDVTLNVQDVINRNFSLRVGATSESISVSAAENPIDTSDGAVGTVIDRNFVSNIPLNGRSFQTLISLSPGVVMVPVGANGYDQGQFSVNGQRANANYFSVDGVSANFGMGVGESFGQGTSGSLPATNIQGGFSNLVSVDDLQEFKVLTSSFAPEFGRSPGAQISLVTRSGTNDFHGSLFEYFRNDALDSMDYFDIKKPPLRYNDFGGTVGGPIWKNHTFFFFSYEAQRFLLPQPTVTGYVPTLADRQNAPNATAKAILDAYALPNGPDLIIPSFTDPTKMIAVASQLKATFSNPNSMNSYSLRVDHSFNQRFSIFGRYNYAPSSTDIREGSLSIYDRDQQNTETLTLGSTQVFGNHMVNEVRLNGSRLTSQSGTFFDGMGGGKPLPTDIFLPNGSGSQRRYTYSIAFMDSMTYGDVAKNKGQSVNVVDNLSYTLGSHQLKFGVDSRWDYPRQASDDLVVSAFFMGANIEPFTSLLPTGGDVYSGKPLSFTYGRSPQMTLESKNFSAYAQDTWKVNQRLTLTYGTRWDVNPAPTARGDKTLFTLAAYPNLSVLNQSSLALAPSGKPFYNTSYLNFGPRVGVAYVISNNPGHELVLRGGGGVFYDLGSTPFANGGWPYNYTTTASTPVSVPVQAASIPLPPVNFVPSPTNRASGIVVAAPGFTMPRTYQWNVTLEQALGQNQSFSLAYVGAAGRDLLRTTTLFIADPNATPGVTPTTFYSPNFSSLTIVGNDANSDYDSLQAQFTRNLAHGLQGLLNYTWAHSIDNSSSDGAVDMPGYVYPANINRGNSDFDIRHSFSGAVTYDIPSIPWNNLATKVLHNWAVSSTFYAHSGLPFDVQISEQNAYGFSQSIRRPDLVPGVPEIINDPTAPGGWRLNPSAFAIPAATTGQGNMARNSLHGFPAWQVDMGINRKFTIVENLGLDFRADFFNILNHPNFLAPNNVIDYTSGVPVYDNNFGIAQSTLARGYGGGYGAGFNPLFQNGGPRSIQFSLRLSF